MKHGIPPKNEVGNRSTAGLVLIFL